jgi:hypothetical protein
MKEVPLPAYRVTVCKNQREKGVGEEGGPGNPLWDLAGGESERELGQADHVSYLIRAVEFPLCWGEPCEVAIKLVGDE